MPHFVIDCSKNVIEMTSPDEIIQDVFDAAKSTTLFKEKNIKVRINTYEYYNNGNTKDDFIHVFANIMEGRSTSQKKHLSEKITAKLKEKLPSIPIISINVRDFEKATYCNKSMV